MRPSELSRQPVEALVAWARERAKTTYDSCAAFNATADPALRGEHTREAVSAAGDVIAAANDLRRRGNALPDDLEAAEQFSREVMRAMARGGDKDPRYQTLEVLLDWAAQCDARIGRRINAAEGLGSVHARGAVWREAYGHAIRLISIVDELRARGYRISEDLAEADRLAREVRTKTHVGGVGEGCLVGMQGLRCIGCCGGIFFTVLGFLLFLVLRLVL